MSRHRMEVRDLITWHVHGVLRSMKRPTANRGTPACVDDGQATHSLSATTVQEPPAVRGYRTLGRARWSGGAVRSAREPQPPKRCAQADEQAGCAFESLMALILRR